MYCNSHVNLFATFEKRKTRTNIPFVECHKIFVSTDAWNLIPKDK